MYNMVNMQQVEWATRECHRQRTSPKRVYNLLQALLVAKVRALRLLNQYGAGEISIEDHRHVSVDFIKSLGMAIEPSKNRRGFRNVRIFVGNSEKAPVDELPGLIDRLVEHQNALTPEEFFFEFEEIHPFVDGNGRVGSVLYNFLSGTMDTPKDAPWKDSWGNDPMHLNDNWS